MERSSTHPSGVRQALFLPWAVFLVSRAFFIFFEPEESTADHLYFEYARQFELANLRGENFYELHAQEAQREIDSARAAGRAPPGAETRLIEYPPLAVLALAAPIKAVSLPVEDPSARPRLASVYATAYRAEMFLFDLLAFWCVSRLARRLFPHESPAERRERLWVYVIAGPALCHVLYDRLDLGMSALIVLSLALLVSKRHYAWSFAVLALAIHVKLVPLLLVPVWLLAASPLDARSRFLAGLLSRGLLMLALILGPAVLFYLLFGPRSLDFLRYHGDRGLQVESTWSSVLMLLGLLGHEYHLEHTHRAFDLVSPLSPLLASASTYVVVGLVLTASALLARQVLKAPRRSISTPYSVPGTQNSPANHSAGSDALPVTFAQAEPAACVAFTLLVLLIGVAGGQVLSPQYLLWLAPLAALAPLSPKRRQAFLCLFLAACLLTTLLFPYLYWSHLVRITILPGGERIYEDPANPSLLGVLLLAARNSLVIALCLTMFVHVLSRKRERRGLATAADASGSDSARKTAT